MTNTQVEPLTSRIQVLVTETEREQAEKLAAKEERTLSYIGRRALLAELRKAGRR